MNITLASRYYARTASNQSFSHFFLTTTIHIHRGVIRKLEFFYFWRGKLIHFARLSRYLDNFPIHFSDFGKGTFRRSTPSRRYWYRDQSYQLPIQYKEIAADLNSYAISPKLAIYGFNLCKSDPLRQTVSKEAVFFGFFSDPHHLHTCINILRSFSHLHLPRAFFTYLIQYRYCSFISLARYIIDSYSHA